MHLCSAGAKTARRWMFDWKIMKCRGRRKVGGSRDVSDGNNKRKFSSQLSGQQMSEIAITRSDRNENLD